MARAWTVVVVVVAVLGIAGCEGAKPDPRCDIEEPASVEVGVWDNSSDEFIDLADGAEVIVMLGPGGNFYFIQVALRVRGMYPGQEGRVDDPEDPEFWIEALLDGEDISDGDRYRRGLWSTDDAWIVHGVWVRFLAQIEIVEGQRFVLRAHVVDMCGRTAADELEVVLGR